MAVIKTVESQEKSNIFIARNAYTAENLAQMFMNNALVYALKQSDCRTCFLTFRIILAGRSRFSSYNLACGEGECPSFKPLLGCSSWLVGPEGPPACRAKNLQVV